MRICALALLGVTIGVACASPAELARTRALSHGGSARSVRAEVVRHAMAMIGVPYRYGGASPERGFDCSGLVVYSYAEAGVMGLPHSAAALEKGATSVRLGDLKPGDLLFFDLSGKKAVHVGIYVGGRAFVHAPSRGKRVERVSFDDVYWGDKLGRAGRLVR